MTRVSFIFCYSAIASAASTSAKRAIASATAIANRPIVVVTAMPSIAVKHTVTSKQPVAVGKPPTAIARACTDARLAGSFR